MIKMKKNKFILTSVEALMAVSPMLSFGSQAHTVQAADTTITKTIMHTSIAYNRDGKSTGTKYYAYKTVDVVTKPVKINGNLYYKVNGLNHYLRATNIDGVTRKVTHNTYVYKSSNGRTSYNGRWKLYKGETVTTYGGSYKFKNGKHYFRIGGPSKQYIKSANLGPVIKTNTSVNRSGSSSASTNSEETTVTVTTPTRLITQTSNGYKGTAHITPVGTKFTVDRLEFNELSKRSENDDHFYHIKGTDQWINASDVKAAKSIPLHDYFFENFSYITFPKDTDVYNADGTIQDHNGQKISKQKGQLKVDKLVYIWVPSENKAELFYHLVGTSFYASTTPTVHWSTINVGHNAYVKASDVKFIDGSVKLTPSNTAAEAEAAAKK